MKIFKKIFLLFIFLLFCFNILLFSYSPTKSTQITDNPDNYLNKKVLIYIKFDVLSGEDNFENVGFFTELNVKGIKYKYKLSNKDLVKQIKNLKNRDKVTVKGIVKIDGFIPVIEVHSIDKDWVDTNLLPATPDYITVTCPKCGHTFKYKITDKDYKKSVIDSRTKDTLTPVTQKNIKKSDSEDLKPNVPIKADVEKKIEPVVPEKSITSSFNKDKNSDDSNLKEDMKEDVKKETTKFDNSWTF
jgi:uncharacterized C2H2 Zn-finger protein